MSKVTQNKPKRKHVPQRTCVVCRTKHPKRELVRIVNHPEEGVIVDETGKKNGRGAYLCRQPGCWNKALHHNIMSGVLKRELTAAETAALTEYKDLEI